MLNNHKVPVFPGINNTPRVPTATLAGNGADLISRHNALVDDLLSGAISSPGKVLQVATSGAAYTSVQAAISDAIAGNLVLIWSGTYTESIALKDRVNLHFMSGATLESVATNTDPLISDNGIAVNCNISGEGDFRGVANNVADRLISTSNPETVLKIKASSIQCLSENTTALWCEAGSQTVIADTIETPLDYCLAVQSDATARRQTITAQFLRGRTECFGGNQLIEVDTVEGSLNCRGSSAIQDAKIRFLSGGNGYDLAFCNAGVQTIEASRMHGIDCYPVLAYGTGKQTIKNARITVNPGVSIDPVGTRGGDLTLWNCVIVADATANYSIDSQDPVRLYGANLASKPPHPNNPPFLVGTLTVSPDVV